MFRKIEVDDEVWDRLQKLATPFVDTPNSVLRRVVLGDSQLLNSSTLVLEIHDYPSIPPSVPEALAQTLEVIYCVAKRGMSREDATHRVAKKRNIFYQTVVDKYTRQLGIVASRVDSFLEPQNLYQFRELLEKSFPGQNQAIRTIFDSIRN